MPPAPPGAATEDAAAGAEVLSLDLTVTLADQLRFNEWLADRPVLRAKRLLVWIGTAVLSPLLGLVLGVSAAALGDGNPFFPALAEAFTSRQYLGMAAAVGAALLGMFAVLRLFRRPRLRRRLRRLLRERAGIDPADPTLAERASIRLGPDGFESRGAASVATYAWPAIKRLDDAGSVMALMTGRFSGYVLPKRCFAPEQLAALHRIVRRHVGDRAAARGPNLT